MEGESITAAERVRQVQRARELRDGLVSIPPACPSCFSANLDRDLKRSFVCCITCGRESTNQKVSVVRKQRLARYIRTGARA